MTSSTSLIISGIQRRGGLVEEHDLRLHGQRAGDGHALLLAAREVGGILVRLVGNAHALEQDRARSSRPPRPDSPFTFMGASVMFCSTVMCGKEVEGLEDHAHLGAEAGEVRRRRR